jgi:hypothetical protein
MGEQKKPNLVITDVFEKALPGPVAEHRLGAMLDVMDMAAQAADKQLGLIPKESEAIEVEVEIIPIDTTTRMSAEEFEQLMIFCKERGIRNCESLNMRLKGKSLAKAKEVVLLMAEDAYEAIGEILKLGRV